MVRWLDPVVLGLCCLAGTHALSEDAKTDKSRPDTRNPDQPNGETLTIDEKGITLRFPDVAKLRIGGKLVRLFGVEWVRGGQAADLTRYLTLLYPRCVFPLCARPASRWWGSPARCRPTDRTWSSRPSPRPKPPAHSPTRRRCPRE